MRSLRRALLVLGLTVLVGWVTAVGASAHNALVSTSPADRAVVASVPATVVLTFDEPAIAMGTQLVVTGPSGPVQSGVPRLVDNTVSQDLQPGAPAGAYTVVWRVTSADGHPVSGTFVFSTRTAAAGQPPTASPPPSAAPAAGSSQRLPGSLKLLIGMVAIGIGVTVARRARRGVGGSA